MLATRLEAAEKGLAVAPPQTRGILRLSGRDRLAYLHRMCTQDVRKLLPGMTRHVALLTAKGHLIGDPILLVLEDSALLELERAALAPSRDMLKKYIIMDQVTVEDLSESLRAVPVLGPDADGMVARLAPNAFRVVHDRHGVPGVDAILVEQEARALVSDLAREGGVLLEDDDLELLRVRAGIPRFGIDMDESRLPMEAALSKSAISFTKGCYIGQEVVARATHRGQLQKGLVQLELDAGAGPGAKLSAAGQEVGVVTSAADLPEGRLGLGYLRRAHWKPGERLESTGGQVTVRRVLVEDV